MGSTHVTSFQIYFPRIYFPFAAAYLLWAIQRVLFNPLERPENEHIPDLNARELATMIPLVAVILWLGVYPAPVLRRMEASAEALVAQVAPGSAPTPAQYVARGRGR